MKQISVIIPCYNVEKYIDRCMNSLVNQTLGIGRMELIFVNDASMDATYEKLCQWEAKYPESIIVVNCEKNGKQGAARNIGIRYASTDYIGFVDSDDWVELDMYEKMYEKAISTGADVVGVMQHRVDETGKELYKQDFQEEKLNIFCTVEKDEYSGLPGGVVCGLYRKQVIIENDIWFPEGLAYEDNYWGAILKYYIKSWYIIGEVLYNYFANRDSTTTQKGSEHHFDRLRIEKMKLEELKRRGLYEKNKEYIEFEFLRLYYINTLHIIMTRMDKVPYDIVCMMQREVRENFPNFENNPYLSELLPPNQFMLQTVRAEISQEEWEQIRKMYPEFVRSFNI